MQRLRYKAGLSRGIIAKGDFQPTHNDALSDTSDFYGAPTLLSGDGQFAVTVGSVLNWDSEPHWDSMISVFELNSGRVLLSRTENSIAYNYFLSAHGEKLVYQAGNTIKIIDTASNQDIKSIQLSGNWILVPMSGSNQFLAFAEGSNAAAIYNMDTGDLLATIESTSHANIKRFFKAEAITGSPIAILFEDGQLYLYDGSRSKLSRLPVPEGHNIHDLFDGSQATGTLFAILDRKTYAAYRWPYEVPQIYEFDSQIIALTDDANGSIAVVRQDDPTTVYFLNKRAEEISSSKSLPTGILGIFAAGANTALVQSETYNTYFVTPDQSLLYFGGRFNVSAMTYDQRNRILAVGTQNGNLVALDESGNILIDYTVDHGAIRAVAFDQSGANLTAISDKRFGRFRIFPERMFARFSLNIIKPEEIEHLACRRVRSHPTVHDSPF